MLPFGLSGPVYLPDQKIYYNFITSPKIESVGIHYMQLVRYLALGLLVIATANDLKAQDAVSSSSSHNYSACLNGYYDCDSSDGPSLSGLPLRTRA